MITEVFKRGDVMFPMLVMTGDVDNVFCSDQGVSKKTGESFGGKWIVQLRVNLPLRDSDGVRRRMMDLSTDNPEWFEARIDKRVSVPVGAMNGKSEPIFFILKGWRPSDDSVSIE